MRLKADLTLLFVAAIWGTGFVAQRLATSQISTEFFNGARFLLATVMLLVLALVQNQRPVIDQKQAPWMALAGIFLFAGAWLQQAGLVTTSIGNTSFITGMYVVLVPLILFMVFKKHIHWLSWLAVFLAALGIMLLSLQDEFRLAKGDSLVLIGAVMWALQIILVGWLAGNGANVLWFSIIQFATCGVLSLLLGLFLDPQGINDIRTAWPVIAYSGILPIGMGFTLQIAGQKHAPPVDAAIILSMESVFGTLFGFLFLHELLTLRQLFGCALLLAAMIMAQMNPSETPEKSQGIPPVQTSEPGN